MTGTLNTHAVRPGCRCSGRLSCPVLSCHHQHGCDWQRKSRGPRLPRNPSLNDGIRPLECGDVIGRARVSRDREQQAAASRGHRWIASSPLFRQTTSVLEQILGVRGFLISTGPPYGSVHVPPLQPSISAGASGLWSLLRPSLSRTPPSPLKPTRVVQQVSTGTVAPMHRKDHTCSTASQYGHRCTDAP